jgi:O-antigen/teichoic acid export membrane protein
VVASALVAQSVPSSAGVRRVPSPQTFARRSPILSRVLSWFSQRGGQPLTQDIELDGVTGRVPIEPERADVESPSIAAQGRQIAVTNLGLAGLGFVTSVVTAQYFGDTGRGLLSLVLLWPALLVGFANLGLPHASTYFASQHPVDAGRWIGTSAVLSVFSGGVFAAIGFFGVELLLPDDKPSVLWPSRLMMLGLAVLPLIGATIHPWRVMGRIGRWNLLRTFIDLVPLAFVTFLIAVGSKSMTTLAYVQIALLVTIAAVAVTLWRRHSLAWDASLVRPLLAYGVPTALSIVPFTFSFRVDQAFLANNQEAASLGHYVVAVAWSMSCMPILNTLAHLALPRVAQNNGDPATVVRHVRFTVLIAIVVSIGLAAVSPVVVPILFGPEFATSGRLALVLVPATSVLGFGAVLEELLRALHRPRSPLYAQSAGLVVTLAAAGWATHHYGVWGAAVLSAVAYVIGAAWSTFAIAHVLSVPVRSLLRVGRDELALARDLVRVGLPRSAAKP